MAEIIGDEAANRLRGRDDDDSISGLGGNDVLIGDRGADTLLSGIGNDRLFGGDGGDILDGGDGDDVLFGHGGAGASATSGQITATLLGIFDQPLFATSAPGGDPTTLYVVERGGAIRTLDTTSGGVTGTYLSLPDGKVGLDGEQGLLGFAFDPGFATNGRAFVSLVTPDGNTQILRYTVTADDPTRLDPGSEQLIWQFPRNAPYVNHAGGWIGFGPDGYLYYASGDGGGPDDPDNNAQNIESNLGKMHRIDVSGADAFPDDPSRNYAIPPDNPFVGVAGADEIWAYGLRNPWRNSFDRATGDLYIGDVGANAVEEVDYQRAGTPGGRNYGWVVREGNQDYVTGRPGNPSPDDATLVDPILAYDHSKENGRSVTGGYVYHGSGAGLDGYYIYGDFINGRIATFRVEDGVARDATDLTDRIVTGGAPIERLASFGEGANGDLYAISITGALYRLDPSAGAADGDDILRGGAGNDRLYGDAGQDQLFGGTGGDRLYGGFGNDVLHGDDGSDRLFGDAGNDILDGGTGNDVLHGGAGNDRLLGSGGNDRLFGDDGRDVLNGGAGNDALTGGAGADIFVFGPAGGTDRILDFESGSDTINLRAFGFSSVDEALSHAFDRGDGNVVFRFDGGEALFIADTTLDAIRADIVV